MSTFSIYFIVYSRSVVDRQKVRVHPFQDLTNLIYLHELNEQALANDLLFDMFNTNMTIIHRFYYHPLKTSNDGCYTVTKLIYKCSYSTAQKVSILGVILVRIFPHSDQNNSGYGHFLCSVDFNICNFVHISLSQNKPLEFIESFFNNKFDFHNVNNVSLLVKL